MMLKQADEEAKKGASSGGADGGTGAATTTTSEIDMLILMDRQVSVVPVLRGCRACAHVRGLGVLPPMRLRWT